MENKFKKIVLLSQHYFPDIGGITTWTYEMAREFKKMGIDCLVITKSYDGFANPWKEYEDSRGINVLRLPHRKWKNKREFRVKKAVAKYNSPDTVFLCADWKMATGCFMKSIYSRVTYFTAAHGLEILEDRRFNKRLMLSTFQRSRGAVAVSSYTAQILEKLGLKLHTVIKVINNGADHEKFSTDAPVDDIKQKYGFGGGFNMLSLGRLVKRKGFDMAIEALAKIKNHDVHYYIAGKGPYEDYLRTLASKKKASDRVHFLGFVPDEDLPGLYAAADVFVMPSRQLKGDVEGFGIVYIEAAAMGTPSIGGAGSGAEDAILDGKTGFLADPESPRDISALLCRLIEEQGLKEKMGEAARKRAVNEFSWDKCAAKAVDFINSVIK